MVTRDYSVLLDTNILMSKTLRDWILMLAKESKYQLFTPYISWGILDEFGYRVRRNEPTLDDGVISTWRKQILKATGQPLEGFPVGSIEGYPDQDDLHVHAAAQYCGMHILVTDDVKLLAYASTKEAELTQNYEPFSADDFLMHLTELSSPSLFAQVYVRHVKYALSRGYKDIDVCKALDRTKDRRGNIQRPLAPTFARFLRTHIINRPDVASAIDRILTESADVPFPPSS
ncbi:MAG: PIN domain-containing protein [Rothia dentocariosa]